MWSMMSHVWTFCSWWAGGHMSHGQAVICSWWTGGHLNLFSHFREESWRFVFFKQYGCRITWLMMSLFFFLWTILSRDDPQKCSYWSDVAFYMCNYDVIARAHMKSLKKKKITLIPHEEYLLCTKFQFFSLVRFQRSKVVSFSNMAATSRDLWRHNYQ